MKTYQESIVYLGQPEYSKNFWNLARGRSADRSQLLKGQASSGGFYFPGHENSKLKAEMEKESILRGYASVLQCYHGSSKIWAADSDDYATFVAEGDAIFDDSAAEDFTPIGVEAYKLASFSKVSTEFLQDSAFDSESYLLKRMAKSMVRAEDKAFITGNGTSEPEGLLESAETGVTTDELTYDDIITLFYSVKPEYRRNAVWIMNDSTALTVRKLKDDAGRYLWNDANDTILGKTVLISNEMPDAEDGEKCIAFGDLSYYWIIERSPVTVNVLTELFATKDQVGYITTEFLDGKLVRSEAVKVIEIDED